MAFLSALEADVSGTQRQLLSAGIRPLRSIWGESGIPLRRGRSLPFFVERIWNAPLGYYEEAWYLINPETREVLFEGDVALVRILGLQAPTELRTEVHTDIPLTPGSYRLVFSLNGTLAGELDVEAAEVPEDVAV